MRKAIILALLLCSLTIHGCSQESDFELTKYEKNGIVFYFADQAKRSNEPVIVLCHGLGGNHQDMDAAAELVYKQGYAVVTLDLYGHENVTYDSDIYLDEMLTTSADKINNILHILKGEQLCGAEQYGIYGYSFGGMVGFYLAAYGEVPPQILISMSSLPDFKSILENSYDSLPMKLNAETGQFEKTSPKEYLMIAEWMSSNNPVDQIEQMKSTAIYMVNGGKDSIMPIELAEQFQEQFSRAGGTIQLYINPDGTHSELGDYHVESILESATSILSPLPEH